MDAVRGTKVKTNLKGDMEVDIPAGQHCSWHGSTVTPLTQGTLQSLMDGLPMRICDQTLIICGKMLKTLSCARLLSPGTFL